MTVTLNRAYLQGLSDECYEIDEKLSAGQPGSGKRALTNKLVADDTTDISSLLNYFVSLGDAAKQIAVYTKFVNELEKTVKEGWEAFYAANVSKPVESSVNDAEREALIARRKELKVQWDGITNVWNIVHPAGDPEHDISGIKEPQKLTALRGSRGPRLLASYELSVNGTLVPKKNALKTIAEANGFDNPAALRNYGVKAMKEQGVDIDWASSLPDSFSFAFPNGAVFAATKVEDEDGDED